MTTTIVQYQTLTTQAADENQRLVEAVVAELKTCRPPGIRYSVYRLDDGVTFVHVADLEDGEDLEALTSFQAFREHLKDRVVPGTRSAMSTTVVGQYPTP